jgi:molybdenum cofactor cytidylyltransferase
MLPALVLAAGASLRMGRPKALLPVGGTTFVRRIVQTLEAADLTDIFVIVRPGDEAIAREIAGTRAAVVVNAGADQGQLSSLVTGLDTIDALDVAGVLVTLVDVPLIQPGTVRALLARSATSAAPILRAVHAGRHGHPVIFKRPVFAALRAADPALGAKAVMRTTLIEDVEVDDPAAVRDIDTPSDYQDLIDRTADLPTDEDV